MGNVEIPKWIKGLPLAPEFRPTDTEFADPIAYVSKIEKEASAFGICKIIPPLSKPSKRYVFGNLNKSLSRCPELGDNVDMPNVSSSGKTSLGVRSSDGEHRAVFTTRHQELGQNVKRIKGALKDNPQAAVHKQVWQSGEIYTLEQFESKSKAFAKNVLGMIKEVNPLVIETLFWKAASEKPIYVEYANDVPGSGFGEPEGHFQYFHKRRRKRASYQSYRRNTENTECKKVGIGDKNNSPVKVISNYIENQSSISSVTTPESSIMNSTLFKEESQSSSKQKNASGSNDMEGTAGWKLSNSPWNLQIIARAPGSLTRFMPDDIPGVTSPMVYIGMLFSWFAWHVEDHELHSMNFLHTGSPKTWYAVPGDYAFDFEEVIRTEAYGGDIDSLAALKLLGEKTTLLSPEIVVSTGIPCCRLVQYPGEFVVTFPRSYHVGFSHGFNCGEAANFGTPQWLKVAKEAAVRRAAMNYLPMLSHQQLLYLLTMSFVSRVPRYLLPGARCSRLRDRQKEEREFSVKNAFIEDMVKENNNVHLLLGKDSTYHVAIWNPDLLPCAIKESTLADVSPSAAPTTINGCNVHSEYSSSSTENDLFKEMSMYMESLNDLYADDDDLSSDFQIDSGTLVCVACGILGFPFMSIIQPSQRASTQLLSLDDHLVKESGIPRSENDLFSADTGGNVKGSVSDHLPTGSNVSLPQRDLQFPSGWNASSKFLRPRIFCLEHAIQIEELLQSKGGANLRLICHSDYQKMKAHALTIAEEINCPFNCNEVSMESASQADLNLIDLAIGEQEHNEYGEDWTSRLGINLQYCVKVRKNFPSDQVHHALALGGIFSDRNLSLDFLKINWQSRRSRSRVKLNQLDCKSSLKDDKVEASGNKSVGVGLKKEKLLQYSRRKFKVKMNCSTNELQGCSRKHLNEEVLVASSENFEKHANTSGTGSTERGSTQLCLSSTEVSKMPHETTAIVEVTSDIDQSEFQALEISKKETDIVGSVCNRIACSPRMQCVIGGVNIDNEDSQSRKSSSSHVAAAVKMHAEDDMEITKITNESCNVIHKEKDVIHRDTLEGEASGPDNLVCPQVTCPTIEQREKTTSDKSSINSEIDDRTADAEKLLRSQVMCPAVDQKENASSEKSCIDSECDHTVMANHRPQEPQTTCQRNENDSVSCNDTQLNKTSPIEERHHSLDLCTADDNVRQETKSRSEFITERHVHEINPTTSALSENEPVSNDVMGIYGLPCSPIEKFSGAEEESCDREGMLKYNEVCSSDELESMGFALVSLGGASSGKSRKRKSGLEQKTSNKLNCNGFIRSPCEGLRPRAGKDPTNRTDMDFKQSNKDNVVTKRARKTFDASHCRPKREKRMTERSHKCDIEGCQMSFDTKAELTLHKRNRCPYEGCRKRFSSHKYALIHQRVHEDMRPLKCPWKGCTMSFKWAWARTEHIRVHTGEKPYQCKVEGCGLSFRFVSDFSRHRRKTGHYIDETH
ncbi:hypothetical protein K2173_004179 [Erythroxylum novogranatense]|uniref:Lysine-specific demethylase ELF6 n=1 Tax=Erythroxylum novogranatense TaxID=1862640 RepID=A0AAV8SXH1_9ROSI|nr:hypothetical protein K2173_004179 [Erythroxylum novogranatense]